MFSLQMFRVAWIFSALRVHLTNLQFIQIFRCALSNNNKSLCAIFFVMITTEEKAEKNEQQHKW